MLIPLAMVCSCQKQDAAAEQQLAQRKVELDPRQKALDEREKALSEREKTMARAARAAMAPADAQLRALKRDGSSNVSPSATVPPGLAPPDNSQLKASREKRIEELRSIRQRRMEAIQEMRSMRTRPNSVPGRLPTRAHLATPVGLPIPARPPALARRRHHHLRRLRPSRYELLTNRFNAN